MPQTAPTASAGDPRRVDGTLRACLRSMRTMRAPSPAARPWLLLAVLACAPLGCGLVAPPEADGGAPVDTVLRADAFERGCVADADCVAGLVGDVCGCGCDWAGIAASDRARFDQAFLRIYMACSDPPACGACAEPYVWCDGGTCAARVGPAACGCPAGTVCVQRYDARCGGGAPECVAAPAACAADASEPVGRRVCSPDCEADLCGLAGATCRGGPCAGDGQPTRPFAVQCYGF